MERYELFYKPYDFFPYKVYKTFIFEEGSSTVVQADFQSFEEALKYIGQQNNANWQGVKIL